MKVATKQTSSGATTGYEAELWAMADALRGSMDASEYKHVVLGLVAITENLLALEFGGRGP